MRTDHLKLDKIKREIVLASPEALAEAGGLETDRKVAWRGASFWRGRGCSGGRT